MSCLRSTSWSKCRAMRRKSRSTARCTADRIRRGQGSSPRRRLTASWLLLASGASIAGIPGLAFGVAGVGTLGVLEFALFLDWPGATFNPIGVLAQTPVLDTGVIAGTSLAFAGLASLVVGFAQSTDLCGRRERMVAAHATRKEEIG